MSEMYSDSIYRISLYLFLFHLIISPNGRMIIDAAFSCEDLKILLITKEKYSSRLNNKLDELRLLMERNSGQNGNLDKYNYQFEVLSLLSIDLEIGDSLLTAVINNFKHTISEISMNVKSVELIMQVSRTRLDLLRDHFLTCEEEYSEIDEFLKLSESHQKANNLIQSQYFSEQILGELFVSADQLQDELHHNLFDQYKLRSHSVETVIKISLTEFGIEPGESVDYIIDTKNDLYVLSRPADPTVSREDMRLVGEISLIFIFSSILSILFLIVGIPHLLGPILIGMILGPSGLDILTSLVQIESFAEFGVFFILFSFGFEFSPENLRKVWRSSLLACSIITVIFICAGYFLSITLTFPVTEIVLIFAAFSLSSTPLFFKLIHIDNSGQFSPIMRSLLGILILQDILFSCIMAVMPLMLSNTNFLISFANLFILLFSKGFCICFLIWLVMKLGNRFFIERIFNKLIQTDLLSEVIMFYTLTIYFTFCLLSHSLGFSTEITCLLAGLGLNFIKSTMVTDKVKTNLKCLTQFFSTIFYTSVGFHVFPSFVFHEFTLILIFTIILFIFKLFSFVFVEYFVLYRYYRIDFHILDSRILLCMSSISEFVLLLGTRARRMHIISREIHLLMLSSTSLILFAVPIIFWAKSLITFVSSFSHYFYH